MFGQVFHRLGAGANARRAGSLASFLAVACVASSLVAAAPPRMGLFNRSKNSTGIKAVSARGEGITDEAALYDALRNAVEKAGQMQISSRSHVENFELIRDVVYTRADGIVSEYEIMAQGGEVGGLRMIIIRAEVNLKKITSTWAEVQNILDQIGRPGIVVSIRERIDGELQERSIFESKIEKRLLKAGFMVYANEQVKAIAKMESDDAASEGNLVKMQAIAKEFGAQIFLTGTANANAAGMRTLAGQEVAMYNGDAEVKMYYTDTAQLIVSESVPNWRGGARGYTTRSPQAGRAALARAGKEIVELCYASAVKAWSTQITAGGELILQVEGMSVADALKFKKKLLALDTDRIRRVKQSVTKGVATFRIQAKLSAETLAEYLVLDDMAKIIELVDLKTNRIQAKKAGS